MKKTFVLTFLIFLLTAYATVHAEYKIILKSGGKIIVNDYKKDGSSIKLYTPNGEIEIDQSNVESIKETESSEKTDKNTEPATSKIDVKDIVIKDIIPQVKKQDDGNKTKAIADKHKALTEKNKKLVEESKKLDEDFAKEGRTTSMRKKRELEQRSQELKKKADEYKKEIGDFSKEQNKNMQ